MAQTVAHTTLDRGPRRGARAGGGALAAAVLLALVPSSPAAAAFPGRNGLIAYVHDARGVGVEDVFTARADGTARRRLTTGGDAAEPTWSRDGRRLAFVRRPQATDGDLWIMTSTGAGATRLTSGPSDDGGPAWSPDGRRIAFSRNGSLHVLTVATRALRRITGAGSYDPSWSPDGTRIAFSRVVGAGQAAQSDLYVVRPDGAGLRRVLGSRAEETAPDWSPGGTQLSYTRGGNACSLGVYAVRLDGTGNRRVRDAGCDDLDPAWSPDGRRLVLQSATGPDRDDGLWTVAADGSGARLVVRGARSPSWQPVR